MQIKWTVCPPSDAYSACAALTEVDRDDGDDGEDCATAGRQAGLERERAHPAQPLKIKASFNNIFSAYVPLTTKRIFIPGCYKSNTHIVR